MTINIDVMLAKRKESVTELAGKVGITLANLHFEERKGQSDSTLEAICKTLDCQPGDILEYRKDQNFGALLAPVMTVYSLRS